MPIGFNQQLQATAAHPRFDRVSRRHIRHDEHGHLVAAGRQPAQTEAAQDHDGRHQHAYVAFDDGSIAVPARRAIGQSW